MIWDSMFGVGCWTLLTLLAEEGAISARSTGRMVVLPACTRRRALLVRSRLRPGSQREPQGRREIQNRLRARCGIAPARPVISFL
jgi:hypothetical protein